MPEYTIGSGRFDAYPTGIGDNKELERFENTPKTYGYDLAKEGAEKCVIAVDYEQYKALQARLNDAMGLVDELEISLKHYSNLPYGGGAEAIMGLERITQFKNGGADGV